MKDNTILTDEESNEIASRVGIEMAEANKGNYDANYVIPYVESLLAKKMEERDDEVKKLKNKLAVYEIAFEILDELGIPGVYPADLISDAKQRFKSKYKQ